MVKGEFAVRSKRRQTTARSPLHHWNEWGEGRNAEQINSQSCEGTPYAILLVKPLISHNKEHPLWNAICRLKVTKFTGTCLQAVIGITLRLAVLVVGMVIMFARM